MYNNWASNDEVTNWASNDEVTKFLTWPTYANVLESKEVIGSIRVPIIAIISNIAPPV